MLANGLLLADGERAEFAEIARGRASARPEPAKPETSLPRIVGREREQTILLHYLSDARAGHGALVLVAGEAGIGKTQLVEAVLVQSETRVLRGTASRAATIPYGPLIEMFRHGLRSSTRSLADSGPLAPYLALLLPELGLAPEAGERPHLIAALRDAIAYIARGEALVIVLEDLHWADSTSLELLPALVTALAGDPVLLIGTYRSDEIPRGHPLRRLRTELRRLRCAHELALEPLTLDATAQLMQHILGHPPAPDLASMMQTRTQGLPFYVQELTTALAENGRLAAGPAGLELAQPVILAVPDSVRDAVLLRLDALSDEARAALEVAAVVGLTFTIEFVEQLADGIAGIEEVLAHGFIIEDEPGVASFRHALVREAVYSDISWTRRRALHRAVALKLSQGNPPAVLLAEHWLAARELEAARLALIDAALSSARIHAYRDALSAGRRALELWPDGVDDLERLRLLDRLAVCAQLTSNVNEASRLWREAADGYRLRDEFAPLAETQRRLAGVYEQLGSSDRALAARQLAAEGYQRADLPAEAAAERLAIADHLVRADRFVLALEAAQAALQLAHESQRNDLLARAWGQIGYLQVRLGDPAGVTLVRQGLNLALQHGLTTIVPELYYSLAAALEYSSDYEHARDAFDQAVIFCETYGLPGLGTECLGCLASLLYATGEWDEAERVCRDVLANPASTRVAHLMSARTLGEVYLARGDLRRARPLFRDTVRENQAIEYGVGIMTNEWAQAQFDAFDGQIESAAEHCRNVLVRWHDTDERHYSIPILRGMTEFFASTGYDREARECASGLATIAAATGKAEALAALASAVGEVAWLDGEHEQATQQVLHGIELMRAVTLPFEQAQLHVRAGTLLAASGQREQGIQHLIEGYRIAHTLGAQPLAERAARELAALSAPGEREIECRAVG